MTITTRRRSASRFAFTSSGMREPRAADIKAGHGYYLGASSSPSFVLVLAATPDRVTYCGSYDLTVQTQPRWIFDDLVCSALDTITKDATRATAGCTRDLEGASRRLAQQIADACDRRVSAHGAPVALSDFDKVECRVSAPSGVDVYGLAKAWGVVGDWDSEANAVSVECDRASVARLVESGLTVESECVVKACPRA